MRQDPVALQAGNRRFRCPCTRDGEASSPRTFIAAGRPLLGSPVAWPPPFAFDARAISERGRISGWVTLGWMPDHPLTVVVEDEDGRQARVMTQTDLAAEGRRTFAFGLAAGGLRGDRLRLSAVLPGGRREEFPDTPLLLTVEGPSFLVPVGRRRRTLAGKRRRTANGLNAVQRAVDIIVPVYLGCEETLACLASLTQSRRESREIVVIDDASPDATLTAALAQLAADRSITLVRNEANLGFPASVNRGLALHPERDAIIVNADAIVHGDGIDRLRRAAYSAADIGSVTPLSNRGSIASYPGGDDTDCGADEAAAIDALAAVIHRHVTAEIPVGVGFCLYLRRDCLNEVGFLDGVTFGRGYGEENDLCLRARQRGWRHVLAADVFVRHFGSRSFGRRREALLDRSERLLNLRYPGYDALIRTFIDADELAPIRRRLDEARLVGVRGRCVILVTLALLGGVDRFVTERCRVLRRAGLTPLVLRPAKQKDIDDPGPERCQLTDEAGQFRDLSYAVPRELPALRTLLKQLNPAHAELHHFLGLNPQVIEAIVGLGAPFDVYIHDYSWICPRITLLDATNRYCGEPADVATCEGCIDTHGSSLSETITVADLRQRSSRWLVSARRVVMPADDVATRLKRYFPQLRPRVRPWERGITRRVAEPPTGAVTRVAVIGAIGAHKGFEVLRGCASDAAARNLPLEFIVLGYTEDDETLLATDKAFVTGRYDEAEIAELLRRERPHLAFFPSVWPETWCYALSHALRQGLPVVAFDLGAIAARLRDWGAGPESLIPIDTELAAINDYLIAMGEWAWQQASRQQHANQKREDRREILSDRQTLQHFNKCAAMGGKEMRYAESSSSETKQRTLTSSAEVLTIPQGLYLFRVSAAAPVRTATGAENITVPAVHVGPGPGISPDQVSFITGPHTKGTWLCEPGNMIVARVAGGAATLILTSIRSIGEQQLAIEVERLDGRATDNGTDHAQPTGEPMVQPGATGRQPNALPRAQPSSLPPPSPRTGSRVEIITHVHNLGDLSFIDPEWAGGVGQGLWIESFTIKPLEQLAVDDIEYKALTIGGFETPWITGGNTCGTQGMASPLVAFAVRMNKKPSTLVFYDCEYSGCFGSGAVVGPVKNGTPCRSATANDPLIGIQVHFVARQAPAMRTPEFAPLPEPRDRATFQQIARSRRACGEQCVGLRRRR